MSEIKNLRQKIEELRTEVRYLRNYATVILGIPEVSRYKQKSIEDYF
jgi:hypothetical protein